MPLMFYLGSECSQQRGNLKDNGYKFNKLIIEKYDICFGVVLNKIPKCRSLEGNSVRFLRSEQSPNQNKSFTGLSYADHSTNIPK
ncbi:Hypothetical protein PAU_01200 [Photorhabdus asymbiotica]|uniref:Uncharacterized protein n=2 Tax=Photorhabdus asymbiotica TaxID=291112 RepID=B6VKE3_PHOAA|nr:hypothetical protein BDD30_1084 [Photorhabdus asymbiotica]CAQ83292.1 Hypothetical protein PAU_01200 [Photorhabdus asymbiotica]CAR66623.1 Hypothetical protein PA-RVA2-4285 [Photorhabdus asymbiotica subsp. asymbiotica ATCC 43949]